jgi:hypothetical protein
VIASSRPGQTATSSGFTNGGFTLKVRYFGCFV